MNTVTVAPITRTIRGLSIEIPVGAANGLNERGVVACDHITTIPAGALGPQIGRLLDDQEPTLTDAIHAAFDLVSEGLSVAYRIIEVRSLESLRPDVELRDLVPREDGAFATSLRRLTRRAILRAADSGG
jgi:mRNA interferase MazF